MNFSNSFLELVEFLLLSYGSVIPLPSIITNAVLKLRQLIRKDAGIYTSTLSTFIQVAGTFLGLYFAAVSVVISTVYARVQGDVRALLMRDKIGDRYIAIVAMLGVASSILLGSMALGWQPGVLSLVLIVSLGVASIYSFKILGLRIFYFFDPTKLVGYLTEDIIHLISESTPNGFWWQDISFQSHFQRQAEEILQTYRNIVYLANSEQHLQSKALISLASRSFFILQYYAYEKLSIPTNSQWFRRTYSHPDWLTASDSTVRLALSTGTSLQPQEVPDMMWFEDEIETTVAYTLRGLFERKDLTGAYSFSHSAQEAFLSMGRCFAVDEALQLFRALSPLIRDEIRKMKADLGHKESEINELKVMLGLTDIYGLGFFNILLGLSSRLENITAESLIEIVDKLKWDQPKSIYKTRFPRPVIEQLEVLRTKLEFEEAVEGFAVTPRWYQQQLTALSFARYIQSSADSLLRDLEDVFAAEVESLVTANRHVFAAQLIERGLEACNKFSFHFETAKACTDSLAGLRKVQDIPWPTIDWESYNKKIFAVRERLITAFSQTLPGLVKLPRSKQLPDYFGHAYSVIADECFSAMADGNEALFSQIFPAFFTAGIEMHGRVISTDDIYDLKVRTGMSAQPLIEILEISGYAIIFSELDDKNFWAEAKKIWDNYLSAVQDGNQTIDYYLLATRHKQSVFGIFPRDTIQTVWKQNLTRELRKRGLITDLFRTYSPHMGDDSDVHPNPLIRVLIRSGSFFIDGKDVFVATYVKDKYPEANIEQVRGASSFYRMLQREKLGRNKGG